METTKRLTEAEITKRLQGRPIAIVQGTFKNIREPAQWICLSNSSHEIFSAPPKQIIHAAGSCPRCGKVGKLSERFISEKLGKRKIQLISGTLKGSDFKASWKCLADASHQNWSATPSSVLNHENGCPVCSGKLPLTEEEISSRLTNRGLDLIAGSYNQTSRQAKWKCLENLEHPDWTTNVKSILYQKTGCPTCAGNTQLTDESVKKRLGNRPIELIKGTLAGARQHAQWRCLTNAEHPIWRSTPGGVLGVANCPACTGH